MDLKTNEFREARASDKITRLAGCEWDPAATAPRFTQFISEVVGGYEDEARYLQKLAGYILSGDRREQRRQILIGDGGDGKSTFIETVKRLMGVLPNDVGSNLNFRPKHCRDSARTAQPTCARCLASARACFVNRPCRSRAAAIRARPASVKAPVAHPP